ncbi:MAG: hypothetical protein ABIT96_04360 [Ferruginibacter sp.]
MRTGFFVPSLHIEPFMKKFTLLLFAGLLFSAGAFAFEDTLSVPLMRASFHDKIINEQKLIDKSDGKLDNYVHINNNDEISLHVTDAVFRKVNEMRVWVENNKTLASNNEKVRYLRYIEFMLKNFRSEWHQKIISAADFPALAEVFSEAMKDELAGKSLMSLVNASSYPVAKVLIQVFDDDKENKALSNIVYLKYTRLNPDKIMATIRPYVNEEFADSLVLEATKRDPVQLYSYAQSIRSPEGKLIHRNQSSMVQAVAKLSETPNALFYFPFLDDLLSGKKSIDSIKRFVGDGVKGYDSVGYYKLLVSTEIEYYKRMAPPLRDTPIAMFGSNGLRDMLKTKALQHFISPINELHEQSNLAVRMRAIEPLTPQELYFMMIMGENDIYTSSYKHSFNRMVQKMGSDPKGDSLLLSVHFDQFKKFIKMAANFNKLDTFLRMMPAPKSEILMKAFVAKLDETGNLEDAVDVADAYSSIRDQQLQQKMLSYVKQNEAKSIAEYNTRGKIIYSLLKEIFMSADSSNNIDLTKSLGIPSIYEINTASLKDAAGRIVEQVFFYGDDDGKMFFSQFVNSFSPKDWKVTMKKEWVEMKSVKSDVYVFANRPLDYNQNLDDSAQVHLANYLESQNMKPTIAVHRGHSYWLPGTISRLPSDSKIIVLGSCGGYKNLNTILDVCPDAHIISTKEIGKGDINRPILNYLGQSFVNGGTLQWKAMWQNLTSLFQKDPSKDVRESWDDYIPPYKNLGAIFIKAYHKQAGDTDM